MGTGQPLFSYRSVFVTVRSVHQNLASRTRDLGQLRFHVQVGLARTGNVEGTEAILGFALNAGTYAELANVTRQPPAAGGNFLDVVDGLHVDRVRDADFWDPASAKKVSPAAVCGLLEGPAFTRTEYAGYWHLW